MKKKIKIIDLLCLISNGEKLPEYVKYFNRNDEEYDIMMVTYENIIYKLNYEYIKLNDEVEILDEEDKDIPLIPDDELYEISNQCTKDIYGFHKSGCDKDTGINYNFKVLKEKINQVVEELNEYRKGE